MFTHSPEGSDLYVGSLTDCGGVDKVRSRDPSHHTRGSGIWSRASLISNSLWAAEHLSVKAYLKTLSSLCHGHRNIQGVFISKEVVEVASGPTRGHIYGDNYDHYVRWAGGGFMLDYYPWRVLLRYSRTIYWKMELIKWTSPLASASPRYGARTRMWGKRTKMRRRSEIENIEMRKERERKKEKEQERLCVRSSGSLIKCWNVN